MNEVKKWSNVSCVNVLILTILRHLFYISFVNHRPLDEADFDADKPSKRSGESSAWSTQSAQAQMKSPVHWVHRA